MARLGRLSSALPAPIPFLAMPLRPHCGLRGSALCDDQFVCMQSAATNLSVHHTPTVASCGSAELNFSLKGSRHRLSATVGLNLNLNCLFFLVANECSPPNGSRRRLAKDHDAASKLDWPNRVNCNLICPVHLRPLSLDFPVRKNRFFLIARAFC